jgi:hypothetical protein
VRELYLQTTLSGESILVILNVYPHEEVRGNGVYSIDGSVPLTVPRSTSQDDACVAGVEGTYGASPVLTISYARLGLKKYLAIISKLFAVGDDQALYEALSRDLKYPELFVLQETVMISDELMSHLLTIIRLTVESE